MTAEQSVLELVGGGLAEWPPAQGPRGETVAPALFVDASAHAGIAALPHRFHAAGEDWHSTCRWRAEPPALLVSVGAPVDIDFTIAVDPIRHAALMQAVRRAGAVYICPTTVRLGINARLARDHSFYCRVVEDDHP